MNGAIAASATEQFSDILVAPRLFQDYTKIHNDGTFGSLERVPRIVSNATASSPIRAVRSVLPFSNKVVRLFTIGIALLGLSFALIVVAAFSPDIGLSYAAAITASGSMASFMLWIRQAAKERQGDELV